MKTLNNNVWRQNVTETVVTFWDNRRSTNPHMGAKMNSVVKKASLS